MSTSNDLHDDSTVTPAADAGPRCTVCQAPIYHSMLAGWSHYNSQSHRAVPQEAAPRECDCEECASRLATAPDWAMRVALEIVPSVHENYAFDDTLPEREAVYAHVAALIREAGSERERDEPKSLWGWPIEEIKSAMRQWQSRHGSKLPTEFEHECASRLLGGESK